ncbi:tumor necrosis factor ligand superfamily member 18 [Pygocentrus nattereri]|uniref:TNF family profile domain-containing protein n=1 Tax=Pygocentrus nattereri TaxID=42514 RepID=A0AAR2L1K0_PYGNA|nr:tumor necrosis factor ligand superfamily member 18 [Pygocentrus nattereri]
MASQCHHHSLPIMHYVMSRSGRQHEELDSSNRAHVAQLRRLVLLLLVWSFFMTLGVAVSISLQFVLPRPPNKEVTVQGKSNHPEIMMYDFSESTRPSDDGSFELKWKNVTGNVKVEVQEDGNYFLYLQVVLQDPSPNVTYTVRFLYETVESTKPERILERHINGSLSTGFMGKGFPLPGGTSLKVTCKPAVNLNKANTYMGIIKFS